MFPQDLPNKYSCSLCQQQIADAPKVLPGCLHVFCLACLNRLPIAFAADGGGGPSARERQDSDECSTLDEITELQSKSLAIDAETLPSDLNPQKQQPKTDPFQISDLNLTVRCPRCNRVSDLPPQGFGGLRTSYVIANMAATHKAVLELQRKLLMDRRCEQCVQETTAASYCTTCRQLLCADHTKCHKMWREFAAHKFFPVDSLSVDSEGRLDLPSTKHLVPSLNLGDAKCSRHSQKANSLHKFFCCSCEDLACSYCAVSEHREGTEHSCVSIAPDIVSEKRASVEKSLKQLNGLTDDLDSLSRGVEDQCKKIAERGLQVKSQIDATFTEVIDTLQSRKLSLCDEIDSLMNESMEKLRDCTKKVDVLKHHVLESCDFVQDHLSCEGNLGLLSVAGVIFDHSISVKEECRQLLPLSKVHVPDIEFTADRDQLYGSIAVFGSFLTNQTPVSRKPRTETSLYDRLQKIKSLSVAHTLRDMASVASTADVFSASLIDSLTGSSVYSPPKSSSGGVETATISSSVISDVPKFFGIFMRTLEGLDKPSGIRVDRNFRLIVCEFGTHQVVTLDPCGQRVGKAGQKGQFLFPQNTACDSDGKMLVVDAKYRIQVFDRNGTFLESVGTKGRLPLQFQDLVAIAIAPDDRVFVCEREHHRIQVLDKELAFSCFIGKQGRKACEFYLPNDIAFSDAGHLYVADSGNHRIQVLNQQGSFLRSFGKNGSGPGELNFPSHICVDSSGVYVTEEGNHRVSVFTSEDKFVCTLGGKGCGLGQFICPLGVAMDQNKTLYVCDSKNQRIQIFK